MYYVLLLDETSWPKQFIEGLFFSGITDPEG